MVGNRLKETVTEGGKSEETVYGYNGLNQLLTSVTTSNGSRISEQSYSYDENGNERKVTDSISGTVAENTYDIDNRLKTAVRKENNAIRLTQENQYDGNGQRIRKTENGSTTLYQYQNQSVLEPRTRMETRLLSNFWERQTSQSPPCVTRGIMQAKPISTRKTSKEAP
mgnify:CR=1 FL=1